MAAQPDFAPMDNAELFAALERPAIDTFDASQVGISLEKQHVAVERYARIDAEIRSRRTSVEPNFIPFLKSPHPAVRLAGALALKDTNPALAIPVLKELSEGRYTGGVQLDAVTTLRYMRQRDEISS